MAYKGCNVKEIRMYSISRQSAAALAKLRVIENPYIVREDVIYMAFSSTCSRLQYSVCLFLYAYEALTCTVYVQHTAYRFNSRTDSITDHNHSANDLNLYIYIVPIICGKLRKQKTRGHFCERSDLNTPIEREMGRERERESTI